MLLIIRGDFELFKESSSDGTAQSERWGSKLKAPVINAKLVSCIMQQRREQTQDVPLITHHGADGLITTNN